MIFLVGQSASIVQWSLSHQLVGDSDAATRSYPQSLLSFFVEVALLGQHIHMLLSTTPRSLDLEL